MAYKRNIWSLMREMENMQKARLPGRKWEEKRASGGFFPKDPVDRTIAKHKKKVASKMRINN